MAAFGQQRSRRHGADGSDGDVVLGPVGGLGVFGCLEGDVVAECFELALEAAGAVFDGVAQVVSSAPRVLG